MSMQSSSPMQEQEKKPAQENSGKMTTSRERPMRRRSNRPPANLTFNYKDPDTLERFISHTRIIRTQITHLNRKQQRKLAQAIKRAQHLALLPTCEHHKFKK